MSLPRRSDIEGEKRKSETRRREFESLITNLFGKMGLETRQTRPSRDGGVDCVAYDPRPIFGGKVVIQAKRYKNNQTLRLNWSPGIDAPITLFPKVPEIIDVIFVSDRDPRMFFCSSWSPQRAQNINLERPSLFKLEVVVHGKRRGFA
jgi:hypothetical protein